MNFRADVHMKFSLIVFAVNGLQCASVLRVCVFVWRKRYDLQNKFSNFVFSFSGNKFIFDILQRTQAISNCFSSRKIFMGRIAYMWWVRRKMQNVARPKTPPYSMIYNLIQRLKKVTENMCCLMNKTQRSDCSLPSGKIWSIFDELINFRWSMALWWWSPPSISRCTYS